MFCKFCGSQIEDDSHFCSECGKDLSEPTAPTEAPISSEERELLRERERSSQAGSILTYAILGLAFGLSGCLSWLGIIFSIKAKKLINDYVATFGATQGRASVGRGISTGGLAASIAYTALFAFYVVFYFFYIILMVAIGMMGMGI